MSLYTEKVAELERFIRAPGAKDLGEFSGVRGNLDMFSTGVVEFYLAT